MLLAGLSLFLNVGVQNNKLKDEQEKTVILLENVHGELNANLSSIKLFIDQENLYRDKTKGNHFPVHLFSYYYLGQVQDSFKEKKDDNIKETIFIAVDDMRITNDLIKFISDNAYNRAETKQQNDGYWEWKINNLNSIKTQNQRIYDNLVNIQARLLKPEELERQYQ